MAEKPANNQSEASKQALDLNALSGLDFGPNWADENAKSSRPKNYDSNSRGKRSGGGGSARDRRSGAASGAASGASSGSRSRGRQADSGQSRGERAPRGEHTGRGGRRDEGRGGRGGRYAAPKPFEPTVKVDLYPQDEAFEALINRLRSSARTYQLFDIAHLLLEKPDRYIVVVSPKSSGAGAGAGAAGASLSSATEATKLYYSVPGHLPFETEEDAVNHVMQHHLDQFFDIEEIEIEAPKGNFPMVNRCTITGELLGPPNYHRYQEFLQRHYAARITGMSFERFTTKVETVKDQEQIDAWLESMKKGARYTVKDRQEGEPESFESLEAARFFLLQHRKEQVVGSDVSVRFAGRDIERLPKGDIRSSVEAYIENQKHFPLDSANNIRGRLRRHKFAVYKKGSKGVSYVCAVKRQFRDSQTVFTESIRDLIEFIEKNPEISASKLPKEYIGIDTENQKPEALKMTEAEVEAAAKAKAEALASAATAGDQSSPEVATATSPESAPVIAEDAKASTEATPKAVLSAEDGKKLHQLMLDLRWLITEGYVTEYGDGRLFAAPPMPEPKPKEKKSKSVRSTESTKSTEATKSTESTKSTEATEATEATESTKSTEAIEATEAVPGVSNESTVVEEPKSDS
jgi:hypothetical protein